MSKKKGKVKAKRPQKPRRYFSDQDDPNHGDGLNDAQRAAQHRYIDNDSLGGETGRYLDHIRGTADDPGE